MVIHKCPKCNATFNKISNFKSHLNRKKSCENDLYNILKIEKPVHSNSKSIHLKSEVNKLNICKNTLNVTSLINTSDKTQCSYCDKIFSCSSNITRHLKSYCKVKNKHENEEEIKNQKLEKDFNEMKIKVTNLNNLLKDKNDLLKDKNDLLKDKDKLINYQDTIIQHFSVINTDINKLKQRKPLPKKIRMLVWYKYIGEKCGVSYCLCCKTTEISQSNFHCGHVLSSFKGGDDSIENLRPICSECNLSMSTTNMNDFIKKYKLYKVQTSET
jgi:5-methylcytosine-specific restriction endonuclease McrA